MSAGNKLLQAAAGVGGAEDTDPDFANAVLLLNGDDAPNGGQNNTFLDSSSNTHTITRNGNVTQGSFSPFSVDDGKWGNYFNTDGDSISIATDSELDWGTSTDFTMECWFYSDIDISSNTCLIDTRDVSSAQTGIFLAIASNAKVGVYPINSLLISSTSSIEPGQWYHIAATRDGDLFRLFINGVLEASQNSSKNIQNNDGITIGNHQTNTSSFGTPTGYITNVRVVSGTALYTSAFTPSTTPLTDVSGTSLLTCQSNRFVDNSSNAHSITVNGTPKVVPFSPFPQTAPYNASQNGGSGYFDGNGDNITVPNGSDFTFSGAFSVEGWIYPTNLATGCTFLETRTAFTTSNYAFFCDNTTSQPRVITSGGLILASSVNPIANQWNHIAWSSSGSTLRVYVNGVSGGTVAQGSLTTGAATTVGLGGTPLSATDYALTGFLSDLRVVNGADTYPTAFTPPTAPLTDITNTKLLCNFTNASIKDATGRNVLETVGNAQVDTTTKKYGTGAMEFDGTGDWLNVNGDSSLFEFGTGDFTIELWARWTNGSTLQYLYDSRPTSTNGVYPALYLNSNALNFYVSSASRISSSTLSNDTWYHIAICRSGTSTKLFVNGTQEGSTYTDTNNYLNPTGRPTIGREGFGTSWNFNGYIDDLRITKGIARYTANFTPPTAALPVIGE